MGAIGGIVDFCERKVDFSAFNRMRLSMALRGRKGSTAFLYDGIGLFFNRSYDGKIFADKDYEQPYISDMYGKITTLCIDSESIVPSAAGEKYFTYGMDFLGCLDGGFALALYDEERKMLLLARDKKGKKPLYYRIYENKVYFSSEPKGILNAVNEPFEVDKQELCRHILSFPGLHGATNLYPQIKEVLPGEGVVFTKISISNFFYSESRASKHIGSRKEVKSRTSKICCADEFDFSCLKEYLSDALIAYDYPEFDCYMPFLMETLKKCAEQGKRTVNFEDATRVKNLSYAYVREDRLSNLYGIIAHGHRPQNEIKTNLYHEIMFEELKANFLSMSDYDLTIFRAIFGKNEFDKIRKYISKSKKNEDTDKNIRILALLCQTLEWLGTKNIFLR